MLRMRSVRSPGEVKHRLLPQSELPWTTGMTGRNEITACDHWLNQRLSTCANMPLIYPSEILSGFFFFPAVKIDLFLCFQVAQTLLRCCDLSRHRKIDTGVMCLNRKIFYCISWDLFLFICFPEILLFYWQKTSSDMTGLDQQLFT